MSSPHMSFRLNHYQLAKALRILVTLEPNQPIASLSQAAKIIIIDWISKHSINSPLNTAQADIDAVKLISSLSVDQIDPYSTIQKIMDQAKQQSNPHQQVQQIRKKSEQQIQQEIEDEKLFNSLRQQALADREAINNQTNEQIEMISQETKTMNKAPKELVTESKITTVRDFSPPDEWKDQ